MGDEAFDTRLRSLEKHVIEIGSDVKQLVNAHKNNDLDIKELRRQVRELENRINYLWGGLALATAAIPIIMRMIGG